MPGNQKHFPKKTAILLLASCFSFAVLPVANLFLLVLCASLLVLLVFLG